MLPSITAPAGLALLVVAVLLADSGASGVAFFVLLLLALAGVVGVHLHAGSRTPPALLRTAREVGLGLAVVVVGGGMLTIVVGVALSLVAGSVVGDGALTVRMAVAVLILGPCVSIGYRCGRWWAFAGAAALAPLLLLGILVDGPRSAARLEFAAFAIAAVALATAVGSLRRALHHAARSDRLETRGPRRPAPAAAPVALPRTRAAGSSSRSARA